MSQFSLSDVMNLRRTVVSAAVAVACAPVVVSLVAPAVMVVSGVSIPQPKPPEPEESKAEPILFLVGQRFKLPGRSGVWEVTAESADKIKFGQLSADGSRVLKGRTCSHAPASFEKMPELVEHVGA